MRLAKLTVKTTGEPTWERLDLATSIAGITNSEGTCITYSGKNYVLVSESPAYVAGLVETPPPAETLARAVELACQGLAGLKPCPHDNADDCEQHAAGGCTPVDCWRQFLLMQANDAQGDGWAAFDELLARTLPATSAMLQGVRDWHREQAATFMVALRIAVADLVDGRWASTCPRNADLLSEEGRRSYGCYGEPDGDICGRGDGDCRDCWVRYFVGRARELSQEAPDATR